MKHFKNILLIFVSLICFGCNNIQNSENLSESIPSSEEITINVPIIKGSDGLVYSKIQDKNEYMLTGIGTANEQNIIVASVYNNMPVTTIAEHALYYDYEKDEGTILERITSITIPEGITSIDYAAFAYLPSLESILLPDTLEYLGDDVFIGCVNLVGHYYNNLQYVGSVSNPCMALIPSESSKELSNISIDERCKFITSMAFKTHLNIQEIVIPESVISISSRAFYMCSNLTKITLPENLKFIGESVFRSCHNLIVNTYEGCSYLGSQSNPYLLLLGCSLDNETIIIHEKCRLINSSAFEKNYSLKTVDFTNNKELVFIGSLAFHLCYNMESIILPESIIMLGKNVFTSCKKLASIKFLGTKNQWTKIRKYSFANSLILANVVECSDGTIKLI